MESRIIIIDILSNIVNQIEENEKIKNQLPIKILKGRKELPWSTKATVIYFYLHPQLAQENIKFTENVFGVNSITVLGWLRKKELRARWIDYVGDLSFDMVLKSIPKPYGESIKSSFPPNFKAVKLDLRKFKLSFGKESTNKQMFLNKHGKLSPQKCISLAQMINKEEDNIIYIKDKTKRIFMKPHPKSYKYEEENHFVRNFVKERWEMGLGTTKSEVKRLLLQKFKIKKDWFSVYGNEDKKGYKKLNTFVDRALQKFGFVSRVKTISQKVPNDWYQLTLQGAERVRKTFRDADVDVVLAADEMFLRFNETGKSILAPKGVKRVGTTAKVDSKSGCTVLPTMDMLSSTLLPPMIIFKGVFGAQLMEKWSTYSKSMVLFTKKHWMTSECFVLYLKWLMLMYPRKKIGVIIDYAPAHDSELVKKWTKELNETSVTGSKIVIEWIDPSLTSIYQPGDITINKPLKNMVRERYQKYVSDICNEFTPGQSIKISREKLVEIVEQSFDEMNSSEAQTRAISKSFQMCGLDPWASNLVPFHNHLKSLSINTIYDRLIKKKEAITLEK